MSASRKLYNAVAEEFKRVGGMTDENDRYMWRAMVRAAARSFYGDNSGFDTYRFLRASGFTEQEITDYPHKP